MRYLKEFKLFESEDYIEPRFSSHKDNEISKREFISMVRKEDAINYSLHPDLLNNILYWDNIYKSPSRDSLSFYNKPKRWDSTMPDTIRLSDHWGYKNQERDFYHFKTDIDVSYWGTDYFTLAKFNINKKVWNVEQTYPKGYYKKETQEILDKYYIGLDIKRKEVMKKLINKWCYNGFLTILIDGKKYQLQYVKNSTDGLILKDVELPNMFEYNKKFFLNELTLKLVLNKQIYILNRTDFFKFLEKEADKIITNKQN
jgi:hypothetical protein